MPDLVYWAFIHFVHWLQLIPRCYVALLNFIFSMGSSQVTLLLILSRVLQILHTFFLHQAFFLPYSPYPVWRIWLGEERISLKVANILSICLCPHSKLTCMQFIHIRISLCIKDDVLWRNWCFWKYRRWYKKIMQMHVITNEHEL